MIRRSMLRQLANLERLQSPLTRPHTNYIHFTALRTAPRLSHLNSRSYATDKPAASDPNASAPEAESESPKEAEVEDPLKKELAQKEREVIDLKDKYLRSVADFRNLQDRTKRDVQAARDFAIQKFAKDLVDSVDNLDRALTGVPAEKLTQSSDEDSAQKDLVNLFDGLKMTESILMQTLKKHGLERFDPSEKGEVFNPNLHEATFQTPVKDKEDGTVFMTQQKGFILNGRVLRAAKVGIVKNS